jgi:H+/Cl- antiporter ClcA
MKTLIPICIGILISIFYFDLTGEGYILANQVMQEDNSFKYLLFIFIAKFIYFIYSTSTLLPGGSFVPLISIGAIFGNMYGVFLVTYFDYPKELIMVFTVLGMCFLLVAVVRTPLTGVILVTEITGETSFFLPLAIGSILVMYFCEKLKMKPIYNIEVKNYLAEKKDV